MDSPDIIKENFKKGYVQALVDVFEVLIENMDEEVQDKLFELLKLKRI